MTSTCQQAFPSEACLASKAVCWPAETGPRNPQASYYRARYYDPGTGRFLSEDPIGFDGGNNFYRYTRKNPVNSKDPSGLVDVIDLPEANIHRQADIDADCGVTSGGCERVSFTPNVECKKVSCYGPWKAHVTVTLWGDIYVATGRFPYKNRPPSDQSIHDTKSALAHERKHVADKVNAILPIYGQLEARAFGTKHECEQAFVAATVSAVPAWVAAGVLSQQQRH